MSDMPATGRFESLFVLPAVNDRDKVTASYQHEVLTLQLPKSEVAKPKRITMNDSMTEGNPAKR
jgi:HSP20 family molecular chaperone IbpA